MRNRDVIYGKISAFCYNMVDFLLFLSFLGGGAGGGGGGGGGLAY